MHGGRGEKRLRQLFVEIFHLFFCALPEIREGKRGGVENIYIQVERRGRTWRTLPKTAANVGEAPRERRGSPVADRYSGYYEHSLDPKGRITIPSKFREQLGKTIAMMRGRNNCICLYSLSEWNAVYEKFEKIEESDGEAYDQMRKLLATSVDDNEMDRQGRLLIPTTMRQYAGLGKDVVVSGAGRHVEVWNRDAFFRFIEET